MMRRKFRGTKDAGSSHDSIIKPVENKINRGGNSIDPMLKIYLKKNEIDQISPKI